MNDKNTVERIEKIFPDYFQRFKLPDGAREEAITVYRACRSGKCDKASFLPSFEERGFVLDPTIEPTDPGQFSLSTYENPKDVKRFAGVDSDMKVPCQIAIGNTDPKHGLVQRTKERTKGRTSHVDWWLYKDASPYEEFEMIADFEEYFQEYNNKKKGAEGK